MRIWINEDMNEGMSSDEMMGNGFLWANLVYWLLFFYKEFKGRGGKRNFVEKIVIFLDIF